jgi:hypothetical protein
MKPLDPSWIEFGIWLDQVVLPAVIMFAVLLAVSFI